MKVKLSLLIMVFLLSSVSAISISPNQITLTGYPGQSFLENVTITSSDPQNVFIDTSNPNINITPNLVYVTNSLDVTLNITFSHDISPGTFNFDIETLEVTNITQDPVVVYVSTGGGTRIIQKNVTQYVESPTYVPIEVIKEVEKNVSNQESNLTTIEKLNKNPFSENLRLIVVIALVFITLILLAIISERRYRRKNE